MALTDFPNARLDTLDQYIYNIHKFGITDYTGWYYQVALLESDFCYDTQFWVAASMKQAAKFF